MNLPQEFIRSIKTLLENDESADFLAALDQESLTSIRFNAKFTPNVSFQPVPWCSTGYYLPERPLFTADPLFHAGAYYVQEASSMFLEQIIKQYVTTPVNVLDLCAAPGGKSTHLSNLLSEGSLLVSNEIIRSRAYILAENLAKCGNGNALVSNNKPEDFQNLHSFFDVMLVDAPCSGEGMFRKDTNAISEWSLSNVEMCAKRQQNILASVWNGLKTGGVLIYSTCTYNRKENEENVRWIIENLGAEYLKVSVKDEFNITETSLGYRFFPHKTKGEGFFIAALRKTDDATKRLKIKEEKTQKTKVSSQIKALLQDSEKWSFRLSDNYISAIPLAKSTEIELLEKKLNVLLSGILMAEKKGESIVYAQHLALSKYLDKEAVQTQEVDWQTAILFLKKEAIALPDSPKGLVLLTYKNMPIGWVKNLGNRCNNLYPQEWRIRMNISQSNFKSFI